MLEYDVPVLIHGLATWLADNGFTWSWAISIVVGAGAICYARASAMSSAKTYDFQKDYLTRKPDVTVALGGVTASGKLGEPICLAPANTQPSSKIFYARLLATNEGPLAADGCRVTIMVQSPLGFVFGHRWDTALPEMRPDGTCYDNEGNLWNRAILDVERITITNAPTALAQIVLSGPIGPTEGEVRWHCSSQDYVREGSQHISLS